MSTHHTRLKTSKQVEQFNVDCFNWRDLLSLERIFERKWNVIWTPFWTLLELDKSCVPVTKLAVSEKKCWHCGQSTYCIWFCSDNFCCWVLPGKGAFHQQFLKTLFDFGSMWQLRIDASTGEERTFFQHACRGMDMRIIHVAASQFLVPNQIVLRKNLRCKEELGELSPCSKLSKQWIASLRKWPVPQFWLTKLVTKLLTKWPVRQFLRNIF